MAKESETPAPGSKEEKPDKKSRGSTEITCSKEASFDETAKKAVFLGDVRAVDPGFDLASDKLTVFLKNGGSGKGKPAEAKPANGTGEKEKGGAIERVIAEGNVIFVQKPEPGKEDAARSTGKAAKGEFDARTGDITLTGWPQVQQGINLHVAAEESTVMIINRDGRMRTTGRCKTVIQEEPAKETPAR